MKRDYARLQTVGEACFGLDWQTPLSREPDFDISARTVRYWVAVDPARRKPIPDWVWPALAKVCRRRAAVMAKALTDLADKLEAE